MLLHKCIVTATQLTPNQVFISLQKSVLDYTALGPVDRSKESLKLDGQVRSKG